MRVSNKQRQPSWSGRRNPSRGDPGQNPRCILSAYRRSLRLHAVFDATFGEIVERYLHFYPVTL